MLDHFNFSAFALTFSEKTDDENGQTSGIETSDESPTDQSADLANDQPSDNPTDHPTDPPTEQTVEEHDTTQADEVMDDNKEVRDETISPEVTR